VVPAGEVGHAHFARVVGLRLGDLARDEGVGAGGNGGFEVALRAAGAPGNVLDGALRRVDQRHRPLQHRFGVGGERPGVGKGLAVGLRAQKAQLLLAEAAGRARVRREPELQAELGVVAQFGVRVQRQVVGEQVQVGAQQQAQALLHPAGDAAVLAAPEQAVVNEQGVGLGVDGGLDERAAGGHARDDLADGRAALDLQAVGSVVLEAAGGQQQVECVQQFVAGGAHRAIVALALRRVPADQAVAVPSRMACPRAASGRNASKKPSPASTAT
jgi:hypothetical protein